MPLIYKEKKLNNKWEYTLESWSGDFRITCKKRLDKEILDDVFEAIRRSENTSGYFTHRKLDDDVKIRYNWDKKSMWIEDEEEVEEEVDVNHNQKSKIKKLIEWILKKLKKIFK